MKEHIVEESRRLNGAQAFSVANELWDELNVLLEPDRSAAVPTYNYHGKFRELSFREYPFDKKGKQLRYKGSATDTFSLDEYNIRIAHALMIRTYNGDMFILERPLSIYFNWLERAGRVKFGQGYLYGATPAGIRKTRQIIKDLKRA